ncbi:MAG: Alpha-acetolactate decarboxylase [Methanoregula sp. PtaU1.Bin051]|nr:MAG: Alpha-acetolactate decarboxylase [Methanoregula sp. PtaU1.Bin051]
MDRNFFLGIAVAVAIVFFAAAFCSSLPKSPVPSQNRDTLYQVSTIDALLQGSFDGTEPVSEMLRHGDFGIGTFDGLDGEMIVLDSIVYQARADGLTAPVAGTATTPFATVTYFDNDFTINTARPLNISELGSELSAELPSQNLIYAIRFHGRFPSMKVRAIPKQDPPYPTLTEASKEQVVRVYNDTTGTVVGFYTPVLFDGINVPGYHLHYISDDIREGGHILDLAVPAGMRVNLDLTDGFAMSLPTKGTFAGVDLSQNLSADLAKVER